MRDAHLTGHYPNTRPRRARAAAWSRKLIGESLLRPEHLIQPFFLLPGQAPAQAIAAMPGVRRLCLDDLLHEAERALQLGISAIALFPVIPGSQKTPNGEEALNPDGLVPTAVRALKARLPELGLITDVALDPYTSHGQDGLLNATGQILNDETVSVLSQQALMQAQAGVDVVAPSDMMDGRIGAIRSALEAHGFHQTMILSYAAKYASGFYGPFRDAVGSAAQLGKADKKTYQMDPANGRESLREVAMDIQEGADLVMVKPGMPYLDVIQRITTAFSVPCLAYQVSGEYTMLKLAAQAGLLDEQSVVLESLLAFRRAGAAGVLSYYAMDAAAWLKSGQS